jgi:hypothetical protein
VAGFEHVGGMHISSSSIDEGRDIRNFTKKYKKIERNIGIKIMSHKIQLFAFEVVSIGCVPS